MDFSYKVVESRLVVWCEPHQAAVSRRQALPKTRLLRGQCRQLRAKRLRLPRAPRETSTARGLLLECGFSQWPGQAVVSVGLA